MSTSTSPQANGDDSQGAIDRALAQMLDSDDGTLLVEPLSDLSRPAAAYLAERWPGLPVELRRAAVQAMRDDAELQIEHTYDRALLVALRDSDADTRLAAIDGLTELESLTFCETLLDQIDDEPDERVRAAEAMALGRFALLAELEELDDDAADGVRAVLRRLLESDPSVEVRRRALESSGYFSDDPTIIAAIREAYESGSHQMRVSALHAMGRQANTRWLDIVHDEFASHDPELRYEAVMAAGTIGDERSVVELIDRLSDEDVEVQLAAIASLGEIGGRLAVSALRKLTEEDSPAIVDAAEEALLEAEIASNPLRPLM
jgi:HEAT repeat protein